MLSSDIKNRISQLEAKIYALQQSDVRYPYDAYDDFPSWYAARNTNPNTVLIADTDEQPYSGYTSQANAWNWEFGDEGRFNVANMGSATLWIKIGNDYVFIIPNDKATIIVKGGRIRVF